MGSAGLQGDAGRTRGRAGEAQGLHLQPHCGRGTHSKCAIALASQACFTVASGPALEGRTCASDHHVLPDVLSSMLIFLPPVTRKRCTWDSVATRAPLVALQAHPADLVLQVLKDKMIRLNSSTALVPSQQEYERSRSREKDGLRSVSGRAPHSRDTTSLTLADSVIEEREEATAAAARKLSVARTSTRQDRSKPLGSAAIPERSPSHTRTAQTEHSKQLAIQTLKRATTASWVRLTHPFRSG